MRRAKPDGKRTGRRASDLGTLLKLLDRAGYNVRQSRRSSHIKIIDRAGQVVGVTGNEGDPHGLLNLQSDLRKAGVTLWPAG